MIPSRALLCSLALLPCTLVAQRVTVRDAADPRAGESVVQPWSGGQAAFPAGSPAGSTAAQATPVPMPGWPITLPVHPTINFAPQRGLVFADLDRDGIKEIIRSNTDSKVYVLRLDGTPFPGWPASTIGFGQIVPTVADLDGDADLEIIVPTRGLTSGGRLYVFRKDGTVAPGWPKNLSNNNVETVAAADLDGDGDLELVVTERVYPLGRVHVFHHDGSAFGGNWPVTLDHVPTGTPAVGDIDNDGSPDVAFMSYNSMYAARADGTLLPGFPYDVAANHSANFSYQSPALGDLDGDDKLEIVTACHKSGSGCYVFRFDGTLQPGWPKSFGGSWSYCPPTLADLDGDGALDVVCGRAGGPAASATLYAWTASGSLLPGFPTSHPGGAEAPITVADIDQDGTLEIFYDSNVMSGGLSSVHCVDTNGQAEPGFPIAVDAFPHMNDASLGDLDGDGALEFGVVTSLFDSQNNRRFVKVHLWTLPASRPAGRILWKGYHEGYARRGRAAESDRFAVTGEAARGSVLQLELQGSGGNVSIVLLSLTTGLRPLPPFGILRLGAPVTEFFRITLPPSGRLVVPLPIPANPVLLGVPINLQGAEADLGANTVQLRQMVPLVLR